MDIDVPARSIWHLTEKERQQQSANVRSVHVGIRHDDDAVVPQLIGIKFIFTDATTERRD